MPVPDGTESGKKKELAGLKRPEVLVGIGVLLVSILMYRRMKASKAVSSSGTTMVVPSPQDTGGNAGAGSGSNDAANMQQFLGQVTGLQTSLASLQTQEQTDVATLAAVQQQQASKNEGLFSGLKSSIDALTSKVGSIGSVTPPVAVPTPVPVGSTPPSYSPPTYVPWTPPLDTGHIYVDPTSYINVNGSWIPAGVAALSGAAPVVNGQVVLNSDTWVSKTNPTLTGAVQH